MTVGKNFWREFKKTLDTNDLERIKDLCCADKTLPLDERLVELHSMSEKPLPGSMRSV